MCDHLFQNKRGIYKKNINNLVVSWLHQLLLEVTNHEY